MLSSDCESEPCSDTGGLSSRRSIAGERHFAARAWAQRNGYDGSRVRLIGEDALVLRYERAFAQADIVVARAPAHAAARGLWRIATSAGLVSALH